MAMVKLGDNFTVYANTHTPSTGAAVDADAAPGYRVYEDETGTPLLTGTMALLDDANTTGLYSEQIAVTTANGFEAGKCYCVRITGVVASVTGVALVPFQVTAVDVDDLVRSTTPANTLDVSATGEAGLDFDNIKAATGATTLTNITVPTVSAVTGLTVANLDAKVSDVKAKTDLIPASPAAVGSAMTLADDAITSAKFDELTAFPLKLVDTGSTKVARTGADSDTLETLSDQIDTIDMSGVAAAVWANSDGERTLTMTAAQLQAVSTGNKLVIQRGDDWSQEVTGMGNISARTKLWFTVKKAKSDADSDALIMLLVSNPANVATDGLVYIEGAAAGTKANGSITVDDAAAGDVTLVLAAVETAKLDSDCVYYYDIQVKTTVVDTLTEGTLTVNDDITRAVA